MKANEVQIGKTYLCTGERPRICKVLSVEWQTPRASDVIGSGLLDRYELGVEVQFLDGEKEIATVAAEQLEKHQGQHKTEG